MRPRAACPVCSRHVHDDTRPYGFDRDRQPVPAWWFTCPKCGHDEAQVYVAEWTPAGIAHMKGTAA